MIDSHDVPKTNTGLLRKCCMRHCYGRERKKSMGPDFGLLMLELLLTTCLSVVGSLFVFLALFSVFRYSEYVGVKRPLKAFCVFAVSVLISIANDIMWLTKCEYCGVGLWKSLIVVSFLFLLISMVIVHLESGPGKRILLIGTTVQFVIYVLGFILFQLS